jgi:ubiquinone/menaquinone biosynthesis C-methylase UbiE
MTAKFWDQRSKKYDDAIKDDDSGYKKTIEATIALLDSSDVVLDLGCASGEIGLDIAPHVARVFGVDTSAKMIELAKDKVCRTQINNAQFEQADAFDQQLDDVSFSAVLALNIFHLVDDIPNVLSRLRNLLPPGGLLISQTPCLGERGWFFRSLIGALQKVGVDPVISELRIHDLESLVLSSGFHIVETTVWDEKDAVQWIVARNLRSGDERK